MTDYIIDLSHIEHLAPLDRFEATRLLWPQNEGDYNLSHLAIFLMEQAGWQVLPYYNEAGEVLYSPIVRGDAESI